MRSKLVPLAFLGLALVSPACAPKRAAPTTPVSAQAPVSAPLLPPTQVEVLAGLLPAMPEAVTSFGAASDGRYLYTLGGYSGEPHAYSREGQSKRLMRIALDGSSGWEELPGIARGLQGLSLVQHRSKLCRVGGNEARNSAAEPMDIHSVDEAACFDPGKNSWSALPPLPKGRSSLEAAVVGDTLYVAGGWTVSGSPQTGEFQAQLLALDLSASEPSWVGIEAPFQRRALGVAEAAGKLVMVGGMGADNVVSRRVDLFDPATRSFSQGPDFPDDAFGCAVEGAGGAVFASARSGVVYRWAPGEPSWRAVANLAFPRFFHQLVAISPSELVAIGGISGMHNQGRTLHVERVPVERPELRVVAWSMAFPGRAKNRQGVFVHGDDVYLFGGNDSLEQHDFAPRNFVDEAFRLHVPSLQAQAVAPFPAARQTIQTVSREQEGFAIGGFGHDGQEAVSFADGYRFDFEQEQWSPSLRLPESRTQFGVTEHAGELWVFGGLNYDPRRGSTEGSDAAFAHVTRVLHATPGKDTTFSEASAALPGERRAFAGATLGDSYYLLGGMRGGFDLVDDCLRFDFKSGSFAPLACPGPARLSGSLVPMNGRLYVLGGSVKGEGGLLVSAHEVMELDPVTGDARRVLERLPFEPRHMHAVAFGGRILLMSTHNDKGRIDMAILTPPPR